MKINKKTIKLSKEKVEMIDKVLDESNFDSLKYGPGEDIDKITAVFGEMMIEVLIYASDSCVYVAPALFKGDDIVDTIDDHYCLDDSYSFEYENNLYEIVIVRDESL